MKSMVFLLLGVAALAAGSPTWGHGPVQDTPEVAAAKAAHLAAVARVSSPQAGPWVNPQQDDGQWRDDTHLYDNGNQQQSWAPQQSWNAPQPQPSWNAPQQSWSAPQQSWNAPQQSWNQPEDDGQWRDDTKQWNAAPQEDDGQWRDDSHLYDNGNQQQSWNGAQQQSWNGNQQWASQPSHLVNGETPEVAAAKAAHLAVHAAAHSAATRRWKRSVLAVAPIAPIAVHSIPRIHTIHSQAIVHPAPIALHAPIAHGWSSWW